MAMPEGMLRPSMTVVTLTITGNGAVGTGSLATGITLTADVVDGGGGTAVSGTDYTSIGTQTMTFNAGAVSGATANATVTPINDTQVEGNESINLTLQNLNTTLSGQVALGTTSELVTIDDNDTATLSIAATTTMTEGGGTQNVAVTLSITGNGTVGTGSLGTGITLTAEVLDATGGTATSGSDFTAIGTQTVTFNAGAVTGAIANASIAVTNDNSVEGSESINLSLQNLNTNLNSQAFLGTTSGGVTINDDDTVTVSFDATQSGNFTFFCTVSCGSGHGSMNGRMTVNP
jgi:hypothetical protein